jgi:hypothetical protein
MALLGELGILEALIRVLEVSAGVLPVSIEKKLVQSAVEIVVMANVAGSAPFCVALLKRSEGLAQMLAGSRQSRRDLPREIGGHECKKIIDGPSRDHDAAVHIELAQGKRRIE